MQGNLDSSGRYKSALYMSSRASNSLDHRHSLVDECSWSQKLWSFWFRACRRHLKRALSTPLYFALSAPKRSLLGAVGEAKKLSFFFKPPTYHYSDLQYSEHNVNITLSFDPGAGWSSATSAPEWTSCAASTRGDARFQKSSESRRVRDSDNNPLCQPWYHLCRTTNVHEEVYHKILGIRRL